MGEDEHLNKDLYGIWYDEKGIYIVGVGKPGQIIDGKPAAGLDKIMLDLAYPYSFDCLLPHGQFFVEDDTETIEAAKKLLQPHEMYHFFIAFIDEVKIQMAIPVKALQYANGVPYAEARDALQARLLSSSP